MASDEYYVWLNLDEALVLYDFAHRLVLGQDMDHHPGLFVDRGERQALSAILGNLETQLPDVFRPDYAERLKAARDRLRPGEDG